MRIEIIRIFIFYFNIFTFLCLHTHPHLIHDETGNYISLYTPCCNGCNMQHVFV